MTSGRLSEILAFEVSGWELVMADLQPAALEALGAAVRKVTRISEGRYTIELPAEAEPERIVGELRSRGGRFVSLNPVRDDARRLLRPAGGGPAGRAACRARDAGGMMGRVIGLVAYHVFKESVRDKVLYNLVLFAVLMIGASYLIGQLTAGQDVKIIKDLGWPPSSVFGLFIAVFIGVGPGLEGGRSPERLQPPRQADPPRTSSSSASSSAWR